MISWFTDYSEPEQEVLSDIICGHVEESFPTKDYPFGPRYNASFQVYIYNFKAPITIIVRACSCYGQTLSKNKYSRTFSK